MKRMEMLEEKKQQTKKEDNKEKTKQDNFKFMKAVLTGEL